MDTPSRRVHCALASRDGTDVETTNDDQDHSLEYAHEFSDIVLDASRSVLS